MANSKVDHEIWTINTEGPQNVMQVTHTHGLYTRWPAWSPDGSRIAYTTSVRGRNLLHVVASAGGQSRELSIGGFEAGAPSWSHDGRWIYFRCERSGSSQICRIAADGEGEPVQITKGGGVEAFESANGGPALLFAKPRFRKTAVGSGSGRNGTGTAGQPHRRVGILDRCTKRNFTSLEFGQGRKGDRVPAKRFDPLIRKLEVLGDRHWVRHLGAGHHRATRGKGDCLVLDGAGSGFDVDRELSLMGSGA